MKIPARLKILFFLLGIQAAGCTNDSEEALYGKPNLGNCNLSQVTYNLTVRPILQQHCYNCHTTAFAEANVILDNYEQVKKQMDNGRLLASIQYLPGHPPMPHNGPKLSDCNIALITKWFESGAPPN